MDNKSQIMIKVLSFIVLASFSFLSFNSNSPDEAIKYGYIQQYKDIAVAEMYRTNIPASIILAQGLLESQAGTSDLAVNANNHFGIKCKSYWQGKTYFHKDDDLDNKGNLIHSCFRNYDSALESYIDHSNFLAQSSNYSSLFTLSRKDFAAWAWGLKKCGYATDNMYAVKLIKIIQKYELYKYDEEQNPWNAILK